MYAFVTKLLPLWLLSLALVACGTDPDNGGSPDGPVASCAHPGGGICDVEGFCAEQENASYDYDNKTFSYVGSSTAADGTVYRVSVGIWQNAPYNGPTGPGTYPITGADTDYVDCGLCVMAETDCNGRACAKQFMAAEGAVEIDVMRRDRFAARIVGVNFIEITPDRTAPLPGGDVWCLPVFDFSTATEDAGTVSDVCVPYGNGTVVGSNLPDFSLQNCNGDWVSLHGECGTSTKALWMMSTAGWCPACEATMPEVVREDAARAGRGLDLWVVIGEDQYYGQPTLSYCQGYAERHDLDPARTFIDHDGVYGWAVYFANVYPYPDNGAISTPTFNVVRASNMEFVLTSMQEPAAMYSRIDQLLNE